METEKQLDAAAVRVFPPGVPLVTVLVGVGLGYLWPIDLGFALPAPERYWLGGVIVAGAFFVIGLWSVLLFRGTNQSVNPSKPTLQIVERGPYRVTRNPMYLQMVLICTGIAIILWNAWVLVLTPICAWVLQKFAIEPEEAYLESKFGDAYLAYKSRVRRWI